MDLQYVKTAPGRRLRHPDDHKVLSCVEDEDSQPHLVDLHDPHWFRAEACGDIVIVPDPTKPTPAEPPAAEAATAEAATQLPVAEPEAPPEASFIAPNSTFTPEA